MSERPDRVPDQMLNALVDGHLGVGMRREVERRLRDDAPARQRFEAWQKQAHLLQTAFEPLMTEPMPLSIMLAVRGGQAGADGEQSAGRWRAALPFFAGLVVGVIIGAVAWHFRGHILF